MMKTESNSERACTVEGDALPFLIVFADANGESRFVQCYGASARAAVDYGLQRFEQEDGEEFDPAQYSVVHIFPGYVEPCIARETMSS